MGSLRTVLFINAHSRRGNKHCREVIDFFKSQQNFEIIDVMVVKRLKRLDEYLEKLADKKSVDCVIVGSGDGTIVAVLNALKRRRNICYGFVPLGTSNTFVRSLGFPPDLKDSLELIAKQKVSQVSLGAVNGRLFANIAGIGMPVSVAGRISNRSKKLFGPVAYVLSGLKEITRHKAMLCDIMYDGRRDSFYTHHLLIANGPYHGHMPVSDQLTLQKDELMLMAVGVGQSRWQYAKSIIRFGFGRHQSDPKVKMFTFKSGRLKTTPVRAVEADGELIGRTPAKISVKPAAIRVFTP